MAPIDILFASALGFSPYIEALVSRDQLRLKWLQAGDVFDDPPLIAIQQKGRHRRVYAVGRSVSGVDGQADISVHNPFESLDPLFPELDLVEAIFKHAIREVFKARWILAPRVALKLAGRVTPLSASETKMLAQFASSCGLVMLYIFLDEQPLPAAANYSHKTLSAQANYTIKPKER